MAIGLTSEQLFDSFLKCTLERYKEMQGKAEAMETGENPLMTQLASGFDQIGLPIKSSHVLLAMPIFQALADTIALNNEALAKSIHVVD